MYLHTHTHNFPDILVQAIFCSIAIALCFVHKEKKIIHKEKRSADVLTHTHTHTHTQFS